MDVAEGYARNSLIPSKKAQEATEANLSNIEAMKAQMAADDATRSEARAEALQALKAQTVTMKVKITGQGALYSKVTAADIASAITEQLSVTIAPEDINLAEPIKMADEIKLTVGEDEATFTVVFEEATE